MFADDAIATNLLYFAVGIGDDPMTTDQLCRHIATVRYRDGVREYVAIGIWLGLIIDIAGRYLNSDITLSFLHRVILT